MSAVPKPQKASPDARKADLRAKAIARQAKWRAKAIARSKGKPRPKVKERNEKRIARKAAEYRKVIASDFHKKLRYRAYLRSCGYCECEICTDIREGRDEASGSEQYMAAITPLEVWFTRTGSEPWRRFRSTDAELHHDDYLLFGDENPAELTHVRLTRKSCHQRIEAEHGTRRRFLKGKANV